MLNQYPLLSKCLIHKGYPTQVIIFFKEKALISDKVIQRYTTAVKKTSVLYLTLSLWKTSPPLKGCLVLPSYPLLSQV